MLDCGRQNMPFFFWMRQQGAMNRRIVALGAAACEDDLAWFSMDQRRYLLARLFDMGHDLAPKGIGARGISPILLQEGQHCVDDFGGYPSRGIVVEVVNF